MRFWTTHQSKTKRRVLLAMLLGYLELRGNYKTSTRARHLSIKSGQNRRRRAKGVKKSGGVSGKAFISKPLTVILNLTQRGEPVQQPFFKGAEDAYFLTTSSFCSSSSSSKGESKSSGKSTSMFVSACFAQTSEATTELSSTTATKTSEIQIGITM